jgi:C4-dicarboxylate-specific signal transduction histidine kinase
MDGERLRTALEAIVAEADRAAELLQGFRDFLGKGEGKRDVVCIEDVARDAIRFGAHEAQLADILLRLESATPLRVQVDRVQIRQVMLNLLWNAFEAVKLRTRGTRSVLLRVAPCSARSVQVSVRDTGAGLAADLVPRLFQPFVTTRAAGLGMGLFICRRIVESHGGRIWLAANSSSGATFGFTLPVSGEVQTSLSAHAG